MFYFKTLEKEEQTKPKASRRKKIIKTRVENCNIPYEYRSKNPQKIYIYTH